MNANERYFDSIAPLYDGLNPIEHDVELYCQQAADVDGRVLEIGCGTGRVYLQLLRQGVDAYGIEISREMLAELELEPKPRDWSQPSNEPTCATSRRRFVTPRRSSW